MVDNKKALEYYQLGDSLLKQDPEQALIYYEKSIEQDPSLVKAHNNISVCHIEKLNYEKGLESCNQTL
jgi:tetratricopeptide (TPR) repeat protein